MDSIKIAILSNFTASHFPEMLYELLMNQGVEPSFYEAGFKQIVEEALNPKSRVYQFAPDLILLFLDEDFVLDRMPIPWVIRQDLEGASHAAIACIDSVITAIRASSDALVIVNTLLISKNFMNQIVDYPSKSKASLFFSHFNQALIEASLLHPNIVVLDSSILLQNQSIKRLKDERLFVYAGMSFDDSLLLQFACEIKKIIQAKRGLSKKCLVLDLDGTLWGGVIGDDGVSGITLGGAYEGAAYQRFQKSIKQLMHQGVLLAINSKNEFENVHEVFSIHPEMILKLEDFSAIESNWQPKTDNLKAISKTLNLTLDSLVFIDDNSRECALVQGVLPDVTVIQLGKDPCDSVEALNEAGLFNRLELTDADLNRTRQYQAEIKRKALSVTYENMEAYLHALCIQLSIFVPGPLDIARVSQLTIRTNQFNLTGCRYSEGEVASRLTDPDCLIFSFKASDQFGDHGLVGAVFAEQQRNALWIKNFLLSCRVFSRQIEDAVLRILLNFAKQKGLDAVIGEYQPTAKNRLAVDFYLRNGFVACHPEIMNRATGSSELELPGSCGLAASITERKKTFSHPLTEIKPIPTWIQLTSTILEFQ